MDPRVYVLIVPLAFNRYLKRNVDNKSSMDLRVYFLCISLGFSSVCKKGYKQSVLYEYPGLFPLALNIYPRNIDNKSSMDLLVYFLQLLNDILERI